MIEQIIVAIIVFVICCIGGIILGIISGKGEVVIAFFVLGIAFAIITLIGSNPMQSAFVN